MMRRPFLFFATLASVSLLACVQYLPTVDEDGQPIEAADSGDVIEDPTPDYEPMAEIQLDAFGPDGIAGEILFRTWSDPSRDSLWAMLTLNSCERGTHYVVAISAGKSCDSADSIGEPLRVLDGINGPCDRPSLLATTQRGASTAEWLIYGKRDQSVLARAITVYDALEDGTPRNIIACGTFKKAD
jgi:hypothetical protein